ncbi:hypothetical protein NG895_02140 [Aeoliella sp. ICT_H6.2]|uniref:Uncharacterized protein n=1 Tax=Aeoliella straminimaris TaxID=2954799 RepID=A0A9X2FAZ6_9BACT|nr:hypothetical protein [Aeoliella straminimaris]MCO6042696.1 hypothetical protein [Aeoliella straminimaris]
MSATKISFSLNSEEGIEVLQQAATAAGAKSESLHAKQIVMASLGQTDQAPDLSGHLEDVFRETIALRRQIDGLRQIVNDGVTQLAAQVASSQSAVTDREAVTREDLRNALFLVLLEKNPSSQEEAGQIAAAAVPLRKAEPR